MVDDLVKNRGHRRGEEQLSVAGHKLNALDLEACLRAHDAVADAAVVGVPAKGGEEAIHAFVRLEPDVTPTDVLQADIKGWMRREIGAHAAPEVVQFVAALPHTKSNEIARGLLKKVAEGQTSGLDTADLADPSVAEALVKGRAKAEA
ncbi:AMP-binding enzyme [Phenylobacterium soli]|uniref:AMP-binding enzyme n=1 Tax=Phenylobacterium soli TaxID=2170551 RepID=UPI001D0553B7|nr:hypothetical protein [Phenylobacterium soli]